jgi:predicted nucleic acid-binding protein
MTVLVDTSVWVDHFRRRNEELANLLGRDLALIHPMVLLELACGTPPAPRTQTLSDLGLLMAAERATLDEVVQFVEREKLYGLGCGLVDMTLLASTLVTPGAKLWTLDRRLGDLADRFGVAHQPVAPH